MAKIYGELERAQLQRSATDIANPVSGMLYYNTTTNVIKLYTGSAWVTIADLSSTQTLTGKTLTGNQVANLLNGAATITMPSATGTLATLAGTEVLTNKTLTGNQASNLVNGAATVTLPSASGTLSTLAGTEVLTNKDIDGGVAANTSRITLPKATYATLTGLTRKQGTLVYATDLQKVYYDDGASLNEVGSGSAGSKNYITNPSAEIGVGSWATYADAAGSSPVDGTGGSPQSSLWITSSTTPLRGALEFLLSKTGSANRQGQGASFDFTIENADKAKVLTVSFEYAIRSGTYADGDVTVWIYDKDASPATLIQPVGYKILNAATGLSQKHVATFQTSASSTNYRLIFHVSSTSTADYSIGFDSITVGPQSVVYGSPVTDWQSYTPTWTASTSNPSLGNGTIEGKYRRIGDSVEILIYLVAGSTTTYGTGTYLFSLPSGLSVDSSKITTASSIGSGRIVDSGVSSYLAVTAFDNSTGLIRLAISGSTASWTNTAPFTFGNTDVAVLQAILPISGWSSSVQMSNDTDTRVVAMRAMASSGQTFTSVSSAQKLNFASTISDTHNGWNTSNSTYTAPVSGFYRISALSYFNTVTQGLNSTNELQIRINGMANTFRLDRKLQYVANTDITLNGSTVYYLNSGETVEFYWSPSSTSTVTKVNDGGLNYVTIDRISGPATIAASETVGVHVYKTSGAHTSTANWQIVASYTTKEFDTHSSFNSTSGIFTVPVSGKYLLAGNITFQSNATGGRQIRFLKNGGSLGGGFSNQTTGSASFETAVAASVLTDCKAGDTLQMDGYQSSGGNLNYTTFADVATQLSIVRVGN